MNNTVYVYTRNGEEWADIVPPKNGEAVTRTVAFRNAKTALLTERGRVAAVLSRVISAQDNQLFLPQEVEAASHEAPAAPSKVSVWQRVKRAVLGGG